MTIQNNRQKADLHTHTYYSDGSLGPEAIVKSASMAGLGALAITDHDSIDGIVETFDAALFYPIKIIPGVELTAYEGDIEIHIIGLCIDHKCPELCEKLDAIRKERKRRMQKMLDKLEKLGIEVAEEDVVAGTKNKSIGRLHLAEALMRKKYVGSIAEAFNRYLGLEGPAYSKKYMLSIRDAIQIVEKSGGVAVLAHPGVLNHDELIPKMVNAGLRGIEVFYPRHNKVQESYYEGIARKHNLIVSGGSDFHGPGRTENEIGVCTVPMSVVQQMCDYSRNY